MVGIFDPQLVVQSWFDDTLKGWFDNDLVAPDSGITRALTGVAAAGSAGSLAGAIVYPLTGTAATGAVGTLTQNGSFVLAGVQAAGQVGNLTVAGNVTFALTGVQALGQVGNLSIPLQSVGGGGGGGGFYEWPYERARRKKREEEERAIALARLLAAQKALLADSPAPVPPRPRKTITLFDLKPAQHANVLANAAAAQNAVDDIKASAVRRARQRRARNELMLLY